MTLDARPSFPSRRTFLSAAIVATGTTAAAPQDNVFFGVRAVDRAGHHSPATLPVPQP